MEIGIVDRLYENIVASSCTSFFLYGANDIAEKLIERMHSKNKFIKGVFDRKANKGGWDINGVPVISPDSLMDNQVASVVITAQAYRDDVRKTLEQIALDHHIDFEILDGSILLEDFSDYKAAVYAKGEGEYTQSNQHLKQLLIRFPDCREIWLMIAKNYHSLGETQLENECLLCADWLH